nr:hypothetical protein [Thioclava atlantica]
MVSRLTGALIRAILVAIAIATPAMALPDTTNDTTQIVALVALFGATLTLFEYAAVYPGLIEFRDAPPFNRIRFVSLYATVVLLTMVVLSETHPTTLTRFIEAIGSTVASSIDVPYSPVRLLQLTLPSNASAAQLELVRTAAGMAYLISLFSLGYFVIVLRVIGWPHAQTQFNVWVNLPTFDPTAGGDVVDHLRRDAWFNLALGFLLPFLIPAVLKLVASSFMLVTMQSAHTLIWMVTAWAFLPASLFMRGIALGRIAHMIEEKRRLQETGGYVAA